MAKVLGVILASVCIHAGVCLADIPEDQLGELQAIRAAVEQRNTDAAAVELLELEHREREIFLQSVIGYGLAFLAGATTWRLVILAKNQRHMW